MSSIVPGGDVMGVGRRQGRRNRREGGQEKAYEDKEKH